MNDGTITDDLVTANNNGFWIGRFGNRANPFIGKYDEVRMYNGVQSADRVKADYDTVTAPSAFFAATTCSGTSDGFCPARPPCAPTSQ